MRSAIASNRHQGAIDADMQLARQLGANGTPTFYINGRRLTGAQPAEKLLAAMRQAVHEESPRGQS